MTQQPRCERSRRVLRSRRTRRQVAASATQHSGSMSSTLTNPQKWAAPAGLLHRLSKQFSLPFRHDGHWLWIGGPVPRSAAGITFGSLVIVKKVAATRTSFPELLAHERVHVDQWRAFGTIGFLRRYVGGYLAARFQGYGHYGAYRRIPFEIEAVWKSRLMTQAIRPHDESPLAYAAPPERSA